MVKNGIDCIDRYAEIFKNKKLGLITSISGVDNHLKIPLKFCIKHMD